MNRWQDISISDASLKAEFITKFFNGDYIDAFTIISNNPQLNTKAFVADTINQIATILLSLENNFQNGVIDYLTQQYSNFQNIIDNYNLKGNWNTSTTYQIYNFVTYNNIDYLYINLTPSSGNLPTNTDYWVEINIQGEKGAPGLGVNLQYNWNATTPYNALDVVYYNNALWVARVDNINKIPGSTEEWETLTGSIVSFYNDGDIDISNLSVAVEPVQDLHGFDSPWPAGGGKNKFDVSSYNLGYQWSNVSGVITNAGSPLSSNYTGCGFNGLGRTTLLAGTYTLSLKARLVSGEYKAGTFNALRLHTNGADVKDFQKVSNPQISNVFQSYYGVLTLEESYTFEDVNLQFSTGLSNAVFEIKEIQIELGTAPTAYAPFANICPISGRTGLRVYRTGKNLFDVESRTIVTSYASQGDSTISTESCTATKSGDVLSVTITGAWSKLRFINSAWHFKHGNTYTISAYFDNPGGNKVGICYLKLGISSSKWTTSSIVQTSGKVSFSFTYDDSWGDMVIAFIVNNTNSSTNNSVTVSEMMIELGSTATTYEPYNGTTYAVDWTSQAGTVYGCKLTIAEDRSVTALVDRAILVVRSNMPRYASQVLGNGYERIYYRFSLLGIQQPAKGGLFSHGVYLENYTQESGHFYTTSTDFIVFLPTDGQISAYLDAQEQAGHPVQICYPLATPITITLDPVTIAAIAGQTNNVWSDAGDVTVELSKKYWEEFIKFKLASIYTDYIEPSGDSLYNGLIWFEMFNPQNWSYLTNRNYTWNQINTNNDTWESVDRGDY